MKQFTEKAKDFFRRWWKKILICGMIALSVAAGLEGLQHLTQPKYYVYQETYSENDVLLPQEEARLTNCTEADGVITVNGEGTIRFDLAHSGCFNRVTLFFRPAEAGGSIRTTVAFSEEDLPEEAISYEQNYTAGQDRIDFTYEANYYEYAEMTVYGSLQVKEIRTSWAVYGEAPVAEPFSFRRVAAVSVLLFAAGMFLSGIHGWKRFRNCIRLAKEGILADRKQTMLNALLFAAAAGVCYIAVRAYVAGTYEKFNRILNVFCIMTGIAAGCLVCFRKTLGKKPEIFFLIFCILIGGQLAVFEPDTTTISWDDGTHYTHANQYSYMGYMRNTEQESIALTAWAERQYDLSLLDDWHEEQNRKYERGAVTVARTGVMKKSYWTFFSGVGLYAARVLGMPFHRIWESGRLFNVLAYAILGYFAIRRLKSGKMILAATLLIPECVFLASNYSYDPGVIGFLALGLSYCFAEWQEPEKKLTAFNACVILGALFLGCWTKGVYFPVFLIPMFLPKEKFRSPAWRRVFLCATAIVMLYILYDMAKPFLGSGASSATDTRGGSDVDAGQQIPYILAHPLEYTGTLLRSIWTVIGPEYADRLLTFYAYLGFAQNQYVYLLLLVIVTFTDKSDADRELGRRGWMRGFFQVLLFGIVCMAATSMYIVFTKVGADLIEGFQHRYVLPVLYPAMMLLGSGKIRNEINRATYNGVIFAVIAFVNLAAVLNNVLVLYY